MFTRGISPGFALLLGLTVASQLLAGKTVGGVVLSHSLKLVGSQSISAAAELVGLGRKRGEYLLM